MIVFSADLFCLIDFSCLADNRESFLYAVLGVAGFIFLAKFFKSEDFDSFWQGGEQNDYKSKNKNAETSNLTSEKTGSDNVSQTIVPEKSESSEQCDIAYQSTHQSVEPVSAVQQNLNESVVGDNWFGIDFTQLVSYTDIAELVQDHAFITCLSSLVFYFQFKAFSGFGFTKNRYPSGVKKGFGVFQSVAPVVISCLPESKKVQVSPFQESSKPNNDCHFNSTQADTTFKDRNVRAFLEKFFDLKWLSCESFIHNGQKNSAISRARPCLNPLPKFYCHLFGIYFSCDLMDPERVFIFPSDVHQNSTRAFDNASRPAFITRFFPPKSNLMGGVGPSKQMIRVLHVATLKAHLDFVQDKISEEPTLSPEMRERLMYKVEQLRENIDQSPE